MINLFNNIKIENIDISNSRSKSNTRGANALEYPGNISKDKSTNDLLNNSSMKLNRVLTSKNKNVKYNYIKIILSNKLNN